MSEIEEIGETVQLNLVPCMAEEKEKAQVILEHLCHTAIKRGTTLEVTFKPPHFDPEHNPMEIEIPKGCNNIIYIIPKSTYEKIADQGVVFCHPSTNKKEAVRFVESCMCMIFGSVVVYTAVKAVKRQEVFSVKSAKDTGLATLGTMGIYLMGYFSGITSFVPPS